MSEIAHSTLLKFLVNTSKMSEQSEKTDSTIKSKVPGEQALRGDYIQELQNENSQENNIAIKDYTKSPVITVTKEESTFTKGDLKIQKVIVSEDISDDTANSKRKLTITESANPTEVQTEVHREVSSVTINTEDDAQTSAGGQHVVYKVTKIPKLQFKQAFDKIKKDEEVRNEGKDKTTLGLKVIKAIPTLKNEKIHLKEVSHPESIPQDSPKVDDEFDRIYDEIFENGSPSGSFPSPGKIEDPDKLETKFEEIIHAYDEQKAQKGNAEKVKSKIPLLKRKSEHDIFAARQTTRKNSLQKRHSIDDTKCRLPVRLTREKQNVQLESPKNHKPFSTKNVTVIETINTNISKSKTTTSHQNSSKRHITQETNLTSEVSKNKTPTDLKKNVMSEKASDTQTTKIMEKKNEDIFVNIVNESEAHEPIRVVTEEAVKISNVKENISNTKTESLIITDNVITNTNHNIKKDITLNIRVENNTDNRHHLTETQTHVVTKVNDTIQNEKLLNVTSSNMDSHGTNKHSKNNFPNTKVQKIDVNEIKKSVSINQELRETVRIVSQQFSNTETKNNQHDQRNKISDNIPKNNPKDILNIFGTDVYSENKPLANNSLEEIKYNDDKNKFSEENIESNKISMDRESATNTTERVGSTIQNNVSQDISQINNERNCNNFSQDYIISKLVSESAKKSLDSSLKTSSETISTENNKETIKSTIVASKQNKAVSNSNQQSEAKIQPQELAKEVTKTLTSQEHPGKSENSAKTISTKINNNQIKTDVVKDNKAIKDSAITNDKVNSLESNEKDNNVLKEEEDIILKGNVSRIIGRLDSKEFKVNKCEIGDLPLEESVVSKIALFEQSNEMDTTPKASITKDKLAEEIDKPKIVDEVLKIENGSLHNDSKFSYDTFLNYKKTIKNNISVNENEGRTTSQDRSVSKFEKIYKTNINLNKFYKTNDNKVGGAEAEAFFKNENANKNIINEYKINKEIDLDMRRAKSLAELSYDGVQGRVRQMVVRMNSIDKMALERRQQNEVRKKTRHGSVSERIALFEKKVFPIRMESVSTTTCTSKPEEFTPELNEEELAERISELAQARATYGHYDNMTYIKLSDGGRLPSLVVGTALLDSQLVKPIIKAAIDLGYRAIDTAFVYGNEPAVGEAIKEKIKDGTVKREELFVLAKLWSTNHRHDLVSRACRQSLDVMGLDYFDLYIIHNPMSFKEGAKPLPKIANVLQYSEHDYLDAWFGIESLIKQGLVKRGGVSNFNSVQVEKVLDKGKIKPVINQVECHPYLSQTRLQEFLSPRGVSMSCFGCLGSSGTPRALRSSLPPVIHDPLVRTMAAGLGVTPAQLLISYQVSLGRSVVVKASSAAHLWNNLRALDITLAPAHAAGLAALNCNKRTFTFEGMGDTHKNYPFKIPF